MSLITEVMSYRLSVSRKPFDDLLVACGHSRDIIPVDTAQRAVPTGGKRANIPDEGAPGEIHVTLYSPTRYVERVELIEALSLVGFAVASRPLLSFGIDYSRVIEDGPVMSFGTEVNLHAMGIEGRASGSVSHFALVLDRWPKDRGDPDKTPPPHLRLHPLTDRISPTTRILVERRFP